MSPAEDRPAVDATDDDWDRALDRFEECLASGEAFDPPAELGPLPPRVATRARALLAACDARRHDLTLERDRVVADLRSTQRRHRGAGSAARDGRDPGILV